MLREIKFLVSLLGVVAEIFSLGKMFAYYDMDENTIDLLRESEDASD